MPVQEVVDTVSDMQGKHYSMLLNSLSYENPANMLNLLADNANNIRILRNELQVLNDCTSNGNIWSSVAHSPTQQCQVK